MPAFTDGGNFGDLPESRHAPFQNAGRQPFVGIEFQAELRMS